MRTGRRISLIVVIAVVVFAVLLVATPLGWRGGLPLARRAVWRSTGLELSVGSMGGSPLSHLTVSDLSLDDPDAGSIFTAKHLTIDYDLSSLRRGEPVIHEVTGDGIELAFETGGDGALGGWGRLASGDTTVMEEGEPVRWALGEARLSDVRIRYVNERIATWADAVLSELEASGDQDELAVRLTADGRAFHGTLTDTVSVRLDGAGRLLPDAVELERFGIDIAPDADTDAAVTLNARGVLPITKRAEIRLVVDGHINASRTKPLVAAAAGAPEVSGELDVSGALEGWWNRPEWTAVVASSAVVVDGMSASNVSVHADGAKSGVTIDHLSLDALGGHAEMRGSVAFGDSLPFVQTGGRLIGVDVGAVPGSAVSGAVDAAFEAGMRIGDLTTLFAFLDADGRGLRVATGGTGGGADQPGTARTIEVGRACLHGKARDGSFHAEAHALGASAFADGILASDGPRDLTASVTSDDLAATLAGIVPADVRGALHITASVDRPMESLSIVAHARAEGLAVGPVGIGAALVTAEGTPDDIAGRFSAFEGAASGAWGLTGDAFAVDADLDSLAVAGDFAVSPTRSFELAGSTTGRVVFGTSNRGGFDLRAELAELEVDSEGERVRLTAPALIEASPDSVRVRGLALAGTPGAARVDGIFAPAGRTHVSASLESLRLDAVMALTGAGPAGPDIRGVVHGSGELTTEEGVLELDAALFADDLVANGVRVGDIAVDVESEDADLVFELVSTSEATGRITALGSLPYASDSTNVFTLKTDREFAATVLCSSYVFEAGPSFLPQIRGRKLFTLSGSALLAGRADSLGSVNGAGRFEQLEASWGFVSFSLADAFGFFIDGGAVEMDGLSVEVKRQRALGEEFGGRVDVDGRIDADGRLALTARTTDLDVAHVSRAFTTGASSPVTGILTADAIVGGTVAVPKLTFSWELDEPALGGVRFDGLHGSGEADPYALRLTSAELELDGSVMTASGVVPLQSAQGPVFDAGMLAGISELDVRVRAARFRIDRRQGLPKGVSRLAGLIDADVRLSGALEAPDIEGVVTVRDGVLRLKKLEHAIRDIEVRVTGSEGTATLETASARLGGGTLSASGTMGTTAYRRGFQLNATVGDVDVVLEDMVDARVSGTLNWTGAPSASLLKGRFTVDESTVTYEVGLADMLQRRPRAVVVPVISGPRGRISLDVKVDVVEPVRVESNLAQMELAGGVRAGGTLAEPSLSGGVTADGGSLWYLGQEFRVDQLSVLYTDPRKRTPFVDLVGTADVESSSGEEYVVTVRYQGFAGETVPELTSTPPLSEPDIAALLTFGETMGALTTGGGSGSAGESFGSLARSAFIGGLFGVAETTARRWLRLDTVDLSGESTDGTSLSDAQVTLGKRFGRRLSVDYTTDLGGFSGQTVGLSWQLTDTMSVETKANQEGNHAIGLKFRFRFE